MLTKDLLNYKPRGGKAFPQLVDPRDGELLAMAEALVKLFVKADGKAVGDVEVELDDCYWAQHPVRPALAKLLFDRCDEEQDDGKVAEARWHSVKTAEKLREVGEYPSLPAFQAAVAQKLGGDVAALREALYSDLPEHRRLRNFKTIEPTALLDRLNCAQIQGLLIYALDLTVTIRGASLPERRRFFRCLKFQRLLSEVTEVDGAVTVKLSGPMRIFQNTQSYGVRLANFFPYVLQMPQWELSAELKIGQKRLSLSLTDKIKVKSHYRELTPFVPSELTAFIESLNQRGGGWTAAVGADYLHVGHQSYCFPDVTLKGEVGETVHLEIFHRWHAGQLVGRLNALDANPGVPLILGVAEDIRADKAIDAAIAKSPWFNRNGFTFKAFPTPKTVLSALTRRGDPTKDTAVITGTTDTVSFWNSDPEKATAHRAKETKASSLAALSVSGQGLRLDSETIPKLKGANDPVETAPETLQVPQEGKGAKRRPRSPASPLV